MKKILKNISSVVVIFGLIISSVYVPKVYAKTLGEAKKELEEYQKQYEENQQQQEISENEKKELLNDIDTTQRERDQINIDIENLNNEIDKLNEDIVKKESEIESILSFSQISNGESAYLEYAFGAQDFTDFIYRIAVSEQLTSYNENLVDEYKQDIEENKKKTEELADKKIELANKQKELQTKLDKVVDQLDDLNEMSLSVEDMIKAKQNEIKIAIDAGCGENEDMDVCMRDVLPEDTSFWRPLKSGYISGRAGLFGDRTWYCNEHGNASCYHQGLDLTNYNADYTDYPVYAIASGIVVYVGDPHSTCGGPRVYIKHNINGKIYTSAYWHMRVAYVKVGQVVTKDTQIGIVGGGPQEYWDGCSNGAHLHLELSTGSFSAGDSTFGDYNSKRFDPLTVINFPSLGNSWSDRTTKY